MFAAQTVSRYMTFSSWVGGPKKTHDLFSQCSFVVFYLFIYLFEIRGNVINVFNLKYRFFSFFVALYANMSGLCSWLSADLHPSTDSCVFVGRSGFLKAKANMHQCEMESIIKRHAWLK